MSLCSNCKAPLVNQVCNTDWCKTENIYSKNTPTHAEIVIQKKNEKEYPEIGEPGDNTQIIFKRYTITERKSFKQYAGFDLYAQKAKGDTQAWEMVKEFKEIEGKNRFLTFLFGHEKHGNVFYLNKSAMAISFDWQLSVNGKQYQVTINLSVQVETPEYFLNQHQGHQQLELDTVRDSLENAIKRQLLVELESLSKDSSIIVDFTAFDTRLKRAAASTIEAFNLEVTTLNISGEMLPDIEKEKLAQEIERLNNDEALQKHQSTILSNIAIVDINNGTRETLANIDSQKEIANAQADKDANDQNHQAAARLKEESDNTELTLQQLYNQVKVVRVEGTLDSVKGENEISGLTQEVTKTGIKSEIKIKEAKTDRDIRTENALAAISIHKAYETGKIELEQLSSGKIQFPINSNQPIHEEPDQPTNISADEQKEQTIDPTSTEFPAKRLIRLEHVINIIQQDEQVANMNNFGQYFWNLVMSHSSEVNNLLTNGRLHYIRYEDNYCNDLPSIMNLYHIFKAIKGFDCYRDYSESHIVLGSAGKVQPQPRLNFLKAPARNKLLIQLLKNHQSHISVSQKNKIHDRDMCLVFTNGAHIRMKFTYGMAFWQLDTSKLPETIEEKLKKPVEFSDIEYEFVNTLKKLEMPVYCKKTEKDTTIPIWGWIPE